MGWSFYRAVPLFCFASFRRRAVVLTSLYFVQLDSAASLFYLAGLADGSFLLGCAFALLSKLLSHLAELDMPVFHSTGASCALCVACLDNVSVSGWVRLCFVRSSIIVAFTDQLNNIPYHYYFRLSLYYNNGGSWRYTAKRF